MRQGGARSQHLCFAVLNIFDVHIEDDKIAFVTELCIGGDLESTVPCKEAVAKSIMKQIVEGVGHMHANGHFGHDLSTDNSKSGKPVARQPAKEFLLSVLFADDTKEEIKISYAGLPVVSPSTDVSKDLAKKAVREVGGIAYRLLTGNAIAASKTPPRSDVLFDGGVHVSDHAIDFVTSCLACRKNFDIGAAAQHSWFLEDAEASVRLISDPAQKQEKYLSVEETDTTMESSYDSMDAVGVCDETTISASPIVESGFASEDIMACLLYTSPSPRDLSTSRMPSSA